MTLVYLPRQIGLPSIYVEYAGARHRSEHVKELQAMATPIPSSYTAC